MKAWALPFLLLGLIGGHIACGSPQEAVRVELPVLVDASKLDPVLTDLGYEVELSEARMMVRDFSFAVAGEAHTASLPHAPLFQAPYEWLVPSAHAHPGHYKGGDITGELSGRYLLDWLPGEDTKLGSASLLVGSYTSANFFLERATTSDLTDADDPLLGHTTLLRGEARKEKKIVTFLALMDSPEDRQLVGVPFEAKITETSQVTLHVYFDALDPLEGDTLFDGLDFLALDEDSDGEVVIDADEKSEILVDAYNLLLRTLQTHDHYAFKAVPQQRK